MGEFCTYKRWGLRDGVEAAEVAALVAREIVPQYRRLDERVALGLELVSGRREVLAVQRWPSRAACEQTLRGPSFEDWWAGYLPVLVRFDELVELVEEWETEVVALWSSS